MSQKESTQKSITPALPIVPTTTTSTTTIPLGKIEIDQVVDNTLKKLEIQHQNTVKIRPQIMGKTLTRFESMIHAFNDGVQLPPVCLKRHNRYVPPHLRGKVDPISYEIIDGRHRVAASIMFGRNQIEAIIL